MFPLRNRTLIRGAKEHIAAGLGIGADYRANYIELYAPFDGEGKWVWGSQGGNWYKLYRDNGDVIEMAHNSEVYKTGRVETGDLVATTGNTGSITTGSHLHIQIIRNNKRLDPESYDWGQEDNMGFTDDEVRGGFDALIHDFLGYQATKEQLDGHMNAAKDRQAHGGYPISDFVHDRFKELPPKDCTKEVANAVKGLINPEECPKPPVKDCSTEIAQAVESNCMILRKNLEEIEGLYGTCQTDLETEKAKKTICYKLDFWDFIKSIFKR